MRRNKPEVLLFFERVWGVAGWSHPAVLNGYSWLCAQERCQGSNLGWVRALSTGPLSAATLLPHARRWAHWRFLCAVARFLGADIRHECLPGFLHKYYESLPKVLLEKKPDT